MNRRLTPIVLCFVFALSMSTVFPAASKKPLSYDAYDGWRSIQDVQLSRDGTWLVYSLVPQDGDGEIVARNLKTDAEFRHPRGKDCVITADGEFAIFTIAPLKSEVDKAKKEKKKPEDQPKNGLGIMNLSSGQVTTAERVKSFKIAEDGSTHVAYLLEPLKKKTPPGEQKKEEAAGQQGEKENGKKEKKEPGSELVLRELAGGSQTSIAEVTEYVWNKNGSWLAYAVSSETKANDGCYALRPGEAAGRSLMSGEGHYKGLVFGEEDSQLAFVSDRDEYQEDAPRFRLYHWTSGSEAPTELVSASTPGVPEGMSPSEHAKLQFSKDGARLYFGTAPHPSPEPDDAPEPIKVDIWSYKDPLLQPMQQVRAEEEKKRSYRAVYHLKEKRCVQLASTEMPEITLEEDGRRALGASNIQYQMLISWDSSYNDYYLVNLQDGTRRKLIEKARFPASLSPGAEYIAHFDDADLNWYAIRLADGRKANLTANLGVSLVDETWDTPDQPRPYGLAGWTDGDRSLLIYDRYDIWEIRPDGTGARMVTRGWGRKNRLIFRYQRLDPEEKTIPADKPLLLSATDDHTKATGYHTVSLGQNADPAKLIMVDKAFGRQLNKAKDADTLVFSLSRFDEFPDLWVSNLRFENLRKISDANPQQAQYNWGKAELIDYRNADGKDLRAVLIKPEDFDATKKYPMMVYIYETLTEGLHRYSAPGPGTSISTTRYVSNGYIVLMPDIVYDTGYPGECALKCVVPAVQRVLDMGFVDPARVGIQGHSWGGYQITYLITRTDIFRAVQAGASVSNMISAYGGIRWGSGMSRAFQYEKTQSRIGGPPWRKTLQYLENSPIFWVEKINTPYLTIHNDEDDAVPWYQGIEFITALRQLGKEAYMFNYNGEKHGLRQRENQKHWTVHMDEFFDHHLKGAPRPEWMDRGVPFLERGQRDVRSLYGEPTNQDRPKN